MDLSKDQIECAAIRLFLTDLPRRHRNKVLPWGDLHEHERDYYRWTVAAIIAAAIGQELSEIRRVGIKHGYSPAGRERPEYRAWIAIKSRCLNQKCDVYPDYGGRGVTIFEGWKSDFPAFFKAVGPRPSPRYSIDRYPNNDGNYEPGNVRWATRQEQQANRRNTSWVTIDGIRIPLSDAIRRFDLNYNAVWMRISRGATPEEAIAQVRRVPQRRRLPSCG